MEWGVHRPHLLDAHPCIQIPLIPMGGEIWKHTDWAATWWRSHFLGAHQTFLVSSSLDAHQDAHLCIQIPLALMGGWIWVHTRPPPIASTSRSPGHYGRHLLHLYLAHLATTAPHCDLAHHCLVAVALGRTGLLSHHSTHLLPDSHTVITSVNRLTLTTHFRH